ncbi:MAG: hypothetical protein ABJB69_00870 [Spartobacteria bacterium]
MIDPSNKVLKGDFQIVNQQPPAVQQPSRSLAKPDHTSSPFKVVIDPRVRQDLRRALFELIEYHDEALAEHFAEGKLSLDSYKEYIELFARSLKETMDSREGVSYLLRAVGFDVPQSEINLDPELRWKKGPGAFGSSLL